MKTLFFKFFNKKPSIKESTKKSTLKIFIPETHVLEVLRLKDASRGDQSVSIYLLWKKIYTVTGVDPDLLWRLDTNDATRPYIELSREHGRHDKPA